MASAESIDTLLQEPAFNASVTAVFEALTKAQFGINGTLDANLALDAMSFVAAAFQEAHPEYVGDEGLARAVQNLARDHMSFLNFMRDHSRQTGRHMLEGMSENVGVRQEEPPQVEDEDKLSTLVMSLQAALIANSNPKDMTVDAAGRPGAYLSYDLGTVVDALAFVLGSVAAQSGEVASQKARREFADSVRAKVVSSIKFTEAQIQEHRPQY